METTRQPNIIVRSIYIILRFFGDFRPLISGLLSFLGRSSLAIVNLIILSGTIIFSASHSLELLRKAGASNGMEWVAMTVWELVFIFSSIILANDFRKGNWKSGWATWAGFLLGFAFVEVSNVTGMANNLFGLSIGISTPILLLISKGLLAHQFKQKKSRTTHSTQPTTEQVTLPHAESIAQNEITQSTVEQVTLPNAEKIEQNTLVLSTIERPEPIINETDMTERTEETHSSFDEQQEQQTDNTQNEHEEPTHINTIEQLEERTTNTEHQSNVITFKQKTNDVEETERTAIEYMNEHGELPSVRKLAHLANVSQYKSRTILKDLREAKQG
ncbi:hypothetical protein IC620_15930 [Hazenella sp. IB182357]|uniref:DUF2637 domain-containing protein n=1 Tax=Polycladospora coralii TaxID=2771432 RepID=A0A926N731_9BACL|nr:hypothetical protein [Polycladospora coralii]MBD1373834.1 hypothetical protein [Polycladospora coralii]